MSKEFSVIVCGAPRVGKSTLVNALCGRKVARTSDSLNSHTSQMEKYVLRRTTDSNEYSITIHDTSGIESWNEKDVRRYFSDLMKESQPICLIYCASPGSFAKLEHLQWLIDTCIQSNIFCALVCTNKYLGGSEKRQQVVQDFHSLLSRYHALTRDENQIKFYGDVALCTAVNSVVYEDRELGVRKDVEGINELLFGILKSMKDEKIVGWCFTFAENEPFWTQMKEQLMQFFESAKPVVSKFIDDHGQEISTAILAMILASFKK